MGKFIGFLILVVGALLLLGNFGVIPHQSVGEMFSTFWPLLLIYLGMTRLWWGWRHGGGFFSNLWPLVLLVFGTGFLLENLHIDFLPFHVWNLLIPVGFILLGLSILFGKRHSWRTFTGIDYDWKRHRRHHGEHYQGKWEEQMIGGGRHMHIAMGDVHIGGPDWKLENSRIDLKMGSVKIDLRETVIPEGETVLEVYCKAGDVNVILPEGLPIFVEAGVKFGNIRLLDQGNSGMGTRMHKSETYEEAERKLKLRIFVKFGDANVRQLG